MLKTVLEIRGGKKLRRSKECTAGAAANARVDPIKVKEAALRQGQGKSTYNLQFGSRPKDEDTSFILKKKKLSELDFVSILKPEPLGVLETWLSLNNEQEFVERVIFTLREMYTVVRGRTNYSTTMRDAFVDAPQFANAKGSRMDQFARQQAVRARAQTCVAQKRTNSKQRPARGVSATD